MANYENGEITNRERTAASRLGEIAQANYDSYAEQLNQKLAGYEQALRQNRSLADAELQEADRKSASERFGQLRKLQSTVASLMASSGNALAGSGNGNLLTMIRGRQDLDNNSAWEALQQNRDQIENAYNEAANQNYLAANEAASNAEYGLRGIRTDTATQLNNINPNLYEAPGTGKAGTFGPGIWALRKWGDHLSKASGYITPSQDAEKVRDMGAEKDERSSAGGSYRTYGNSYIDRLIGGYNGLRRL